MADAEKYKVKKYQGNERKYPKYRVTAYKSPVICWKSKKKKIELSDGTIMEIYVSDDK